MKVILPIILTRRTGEFHFSMAQNFPAALVPVFIFLQYLKDLADHSLSARYTPGYQKEFLFATGESIIINDTTTQSLESNYTYKELFGLGYSYKFNEQFNAGFNNSFL